jgi:phosphopantetheinyl transferase
LESIFNFSDSEKIEYQQIKFDRRKKEFLSTRLLTKILVGRKAEIEYLPSRKPLLRNEPQYISISHSENLVAVFLSPKCRIGIDAERMDRNISQVAKRFLSINETEDIERLNDQQLGKILYWCGKESIFKCTLQSKILFNQHISIAPFLLNEEGTFLGSLHSNSDSENFKLNYFRYKNNIVVYCVPL